MPPLWLFLLLTPVGMASAAPPDYAISTFKNGNLIGTRPITLEEMRNVSIALVGAFQEQSPSYSRLVSVAKGMTAKERCFNLFGSRTALASIQGGMLDTSANAEDFLKNSISSIEDVNRQTQVTCQMK